MRQAIILLVIIALLTIGGTMLHDTTGSVTISLASGDFQMPLWYFIIALAIAIPVLVIALNVLWSVIRLPKTFSRFGKKRREVGAGQLLQKGMLAMGKGQWKKAEKSLIKGAKLTQKAKGDPSLFLSTAAQAAQNQGAEHRRDAYLLEARQLSVEGADTLTSALAEARLHLDANDPQKALSAIKPHKTLYGQNPQLQKVESEIYEAQGNYQQTWELLKDLKKQFTDKEKYKTRQIEVAKALFIAENSTLDNVETVWSELSKDCKQDDNLFLNYVSGLIHHKQEEKAERLLSKQIRKSYSEPLIHAYTQLETGSSTQRLKKVKQWLKFQPENPYLNYGAAKFAFESEQFEVAKEYATASIKAQPLPEALALLGKIYEALGESNNALQAYKGSVGLIYTDNSEPVSGEVLLAAPATAGLPESDNTETEVNNITIVTNTENTDSNKTNS